jgi:hypothetical protein
MPHGLLNPSAAIQRNPLPEVRESIAREDARIARARNAPLAAVLATFRRKNGFLKFATATAATHKNGRRAAS